MSMLLSSNVPHIRRDEFDNEALEFLEKYYPEALKRPMAVPILYVARHRMGLRVVEKRLTEDFSVLGQMCFTSGLTEIYDKEDGSYRMVKARYGTMIIDPDTVAKRNVGCMNNTIAHEAFHWHKHRDYHIAVSVVDSKMATKFRCPVNEYDEFNKANWSDEDWMEWQARGIAPRILMPSETIGSVFLLLVERSEKQPLIKAGLISAETWIIEQIARFYQVSKQSAQIRLCELGYLHD